MIKFDKMQLIGVSELMKDNIQSQVLYDHLKWTRNKFGYLALERQIEALSAEHRRALESEQEKFAIKERSNNNRLSDLELEMTRCNGELRFVYHHYDVIITSSLRHHNVTITLSII